MDADNGGTAMARGQARASGRQDHHRSHSTVTPEVNGWIAGGARGQENRMMGERELSPTWMKPE